MSEDFANQPGYQLAKALEAIQREEKVFAGLKADHKASMEALYQEANRLQQDILTGQKQLPLEPIEPAVNGTGEVNGTQGAGVN